MWPLAIVALLFEIVSVAVPNGHVSLSVPEGWRRLDVPEVKRLTPELDPQNDRQRRLRPEHENTPLIAIKHDTEGAIAASAQLFVSRLPDQMRHASSIEVGRVIAFEALATFRGTYEVEPREVRIANLPAAEWVIRYKLVETQFGAHDMRTRNIVIVRGNTLYLLGYSGPTADTTDLEAFESVVKSLKFDR